MELTNDQAIVPLEGDSIDPDFKDTVTTQMILYAGDEIVDEGVTYKVGNESAATVDGNGVVTLINSALANISEIECIATYRTIEYKKTFHILKTASAYEIVADKVVLERDPETGILVDSDKELTV